VPTVQQRGDFGEKEGVEVAHLGHAGLCRECLPWFIQSGWNLAFGLLPPYWAAKAFWVASDNGIWWPYVVVGIVYNVAVAVPLFRRFLSKNGASPRTGR
jgi:hypothetical protein